MEILPSLHRKNIYPEWEICSALYGAPPNGLTIPGILDLAYTPVPGGKRISLPYGRNRQAALSGNA